MQTTRLWAGVLASVLLIGGVFPGCSSETRPPIGSNESAQSAPKAPPQPGTTAQPIGESEAEKQRQAEEKRLAEEKAQTMTKAKTQEESQAEEENRLWEKRLAEAKLHGGKSRPRGIPIESQPEAVPQPLPPTPATEVAPQSKLVPRPPRAMPRKASPHRKAEHPAGPSAPTTSQPAAAPTPDPAAEEDSSYTVVKVFYATDRSSVEASQGQPFGPGWLCSAGMMAAVSVALGFWSRRRPRQAVLRGLVWCSAGATLLVGGLAILCCNQPDVANQPDVSARKIERRYGNDRGELELGTCEVSIPKDHQVGEMESPSVLRLEFHEDPERHVVLQGVHVQSADEFYADLRSCVGRSAAKESFVFIHGYNVGFEDAARRTAQIAYDLKFDGAPIFYSWPSQQGLLAYTVDETNVAWSVPHLKEFLLAIARRSGAKSVHLVAHSMGNRALTTALRELSLELKADCPRFHEVVLTAPDIDADVFRRDLAPAIVNVASRVTLYASSNDEALIASKAIHGYRRAGDSGENVVVISGVDTVDVSDIDTSFIGHCYYGSNRTVLADLFELIHGSTPPGQRKWLRSMQAGALTYWKFLRTKAVASASPPEENRP